MLNWGVMGAGGIAYVFCNGMRFTDSGQILAVASRTQSRIDRLVNDYNIPRQYNDYDGLLRDDHIDAVYIATIHPCLLYTSPSPRDGLLSRMPSSA